VALKCLALTKTNVLPSPTVTTTLASTAVLAGRDSKHPHCNTSFDMASEHSDLAMSESLKRKRDTLIGDNTRDLESHAMWKKTNKVSGDDASLTETTTSTTDTSDGPIHANGVYTHASSTTAYSNTTKTNANTIPADKLMEAKDRLPKPSLQTLPRELRDSIYDFVVATGECIVLGRRMVELHKENSDWTIDGYFDETVALHPLSMTCRQFRDEFTKEHLSGSEAPYVLLVNNFDLD
jgi:hypothetical protein